MLAVYSIVVGGAIVEVGDIVVGGDLVDDDVVAFSLLCILSLNNRSYPGVRRSPEKWLGWFLTRFTTCETRSEESSGRRRSSSCLTTSTTSFFQVSLLQKADEARDFK